MSSLIPWEGMIPTFAALSSTESSFSMVGAIPQQHVPKTLAVFCNCRMIMLRKPVKVPDRCHPRTWLLPQRELLSIRRERLGITAILSYSEGSTIRQRQQRSFVELAESCKMVVYSFYVFDRHGECGLILVRGLY